MRDLTERWVEKRYRSLLLADRDNMLLPSDPTDYLEFACLLLALREQQTSGGREPAGAWEYFNFLLGNVKRFMLQELL